MRFDHIALLFALIHIVSCAPMPIPTQQSATPAQVFVPTPRVVDEIAVQPIAVSTEIPKLASTPRWAESKVEWSGDLHMHTTCSDGTATYDEMVEQALALHLDFIAITDHVGIAERECHNESNEKCEAETRLICFPV